jgi:hypothetical protein
MLRKFENKISDYDINVNLKYQQFILVLNYELWTDEFLLSNAELICDD